VTYQPRRLYCSRNCRAGSNAEAHPEYLELHRASTRAYYHADPQRSRDRVREWRRAHPAESSLHRRHQRARQYGLLGTYSAEEWLELVQQWGGRCAYCGCAGKLTADHRLPLSLGGTNTIDNILPACPRCNSRKHDRTEDAFRIMLLLEAIDQRSGTFAWELEGS
jgi:5-methylcytosine-specific restriction endonuclease McrA